ncbi:MAG TPA: hypothetical protein VK550_02625 [Polyangiaceae bacterium]|nr:hypothetical protein [Polyangiaceae bacterium]
MRRMPFWCALGITVAVGCGDRNSDPGADGGGAAGIGGATTGTGASGGGNTAGTGGAGGQGATGASGGVAGTGGAGGMGGVGGATGGTGGAAGTIDSGTEWGACTGPGQCELAAKCCACGELGLGQLIAIHSSQRDAFRKSCSDMPPCPPCVGTVAPNLIAVCEAGRCRGIDIQSDPAYTKCGSDQDCMLRSGLGCCECPDMGQWVPISLAGSILVKSQVCAPSTSCPKCLPMPPLETRPICRSGVCGKILIPESPFSSAP